MKPLKLKLNNIGPFCGEHNLDFTELGEMYLICGKMGSGKTTIFDAITYALYGKLPGSRNLIGAKALFSDFASPEDLCQVDFTFEVKGKKYRILRNPPKNQEKKTSQEGKVVLYEVGKDGENLLTNQKSEVDKYINQLIGLTDDEFSRIVLLPQGEFAAFLKQKSSEKQKTLAKLFPSEYYSKIIEEVKKINEDISTEKKILQSQLSNITENFNPQTYEDDIKNEKSELEILKSKKEEIEKEISKIEKTLIEKNQEIAKIKKTLSNKAELDELLLQENIIKEKSEKIKNGEKAEKIVPLLNSKNQSESQFNQLILELEETEKSLKDAKKLLDIAKCEKEEAPELSKKLEKEKITLEKLKSASEKFSVLKKSKNQVKKLLAEKEQLENQKKDLTSKEEKIKGEIKNLEENTKNHLALVEEKNLLKTTVEKFSELQKLYFEKEEYFEKSGNLEKEILETEKLLKSNVDVLAEYKNQLEENKNQNLAFILGEKLEENQPCPVCGSLHHPNLVKSTVDFKPLEEKIQIQEKNVASQKKILEDEKNLFGQNKALLDSVTKNAKEKLPELLSVLEKNSFLKTKNPTVDFSSKTALEKMLLNTESLKIFEDTQNALDSELENLNKMIQDKELAEKTLKDVESQLERILENLPTVKTSLEVEKTKITSIEEELSQIDFAEKVDFNLVEEDFFETEFEKTGNLIEELEEKIQKLENNFNNAKSNFEKLSSSKEVLDSQKENRQKEKEIAKKDFEKALSDSDFASETEILSWILEENVLVSLKKSVEDWQLKINGIKTLLSEEKDYEKEDLEATENQVEKLISEKAIIVDEKSFVEEKLESQNLKVATLEKTKINYDNNLAKQQGIFEKAEIYEKLYKALSGDNPKKTPFDAWYLGIFLEEITYYASLRLKKMTSNRYTMRLGEGSSNRGLKGLDIEIVDSYTKKARSVDTLSGGETFLASLSLALALTDTVQNKKGGIQLDSLFIDEGFGSLDETALESALQTLDEVRENRSVGIISHVSELKQRDFNRIEVEKSNFGSEIKVEILG